MSRIDQALSRLARTGGRDTGQSWEDETVEHLSVLEHYPQEYHVLPLAHAGPEGAVAGAEVVQQHPPVAAPQTPVDPPRDEPFEGSLRSDERLVLNRGASPDVVLGYRRLADALRERDRQSFHGLRVVMVTSALPGEGKTLTTVNLALTFSELMRQRVLLVDANLQQPSLHNVFPLTAQSSLAEYLQFRRDDVPPVQLSDRLSLIPAGRSAPDQLAALTSDRMEDLVDSLTPEFDWLLIDTPAVAWMREADRFAAIARGVLFVIRASSTPHAIVKRAIARLDPERVIGTVLNGVTGVSDEDE